MGIPDDFTRAGRKAEKYVARVFQWESDGTVNIGSAVLVEVAGHPVLFTAGHNLCDGGSTKLSAPSSIAVSFPLRDSPLVYPTFPEKHFTRLKVADRLQPDVGYVELDLASRGMWQHMSALGLDDVSMVEQLTSAADECVLLLGFPRHHVRRGEDLMGEPQAIVEGQCIRARVQTTWNGEAGIFVALDNEFERPDGERLRLPDTEGMKGISGGPLLRVGDSGVDFIGLAVSIPPGSPRMQRCVPAYEVVRLLLDHPDADVVDEARRCLERLGVA